MWFAPFVLSLLPADLDRLGQACSVVPSTTRKMEIEVEIEWAEATGASQVRSLPSTSDVKQLYANWLKVRYRYQINSLNAAYGTDFTSFTDLTESSFAGFNASRPAVREDDLAFQSELDAFTLATVQAGCPASVSKVAWKRKRT
ncbi:MAG: hypothetical protein OHK0021_17480 [Bryobacter sp.]